MPLFHKIVFIIILLLAAPFIFRPVANLLLGALFILFSIRRIADASPLDEKFDFNLFEKNSWLVIA